MFTVQAKSGRLLRPHRQYERRRTVVQYCAALYTLTNKFATEPVLKQVATLSVAAKELHDARSAHIGDVALHFHNVAALVRLSAQCNKRRQYVDHNKRRNARDGRRIVIGVLKRLNQRNTMSQLAQKQDIGTGDGNCRCAALFGMTRCLNDFSCIA